MLEKEKQDKKRWEKPEIKALEVFKTNVGTNTANCEDTASLGGCTANGIGS